MAYKATVIADSIGLNKKRITTLEVTLPRCVLAELRTHRQTTQDDECEVIYRGTDDAGRMLSLNSASSRAIPVERMIQRVMDDPFIPDLWPKNQRGMQPAEYYEPDSDDARLCQDIWLRARDHAVMAVEFLTGKRDERNSLDYEDKFLDVHKEIANRLLEPFLWHTVIITATEWSNFFAQRLDSQAQRQMRLTAEAMKAAMDNNQTRFLRPYEWHLPYEGNECLVIEKRIELSVARCARVSYEQHDGTRSMAADFALYERLLTGGHWSPFEHQAQAMDDANGEYRSGNFIGWVQHRQQFKNQNR